LIVQAQKAASLAAFYFSHIKENTMPLPKNPKIRGEWAELIFMARATGHGFIVARTSDSAPYDVVCDYRAHFNRVQVKCVSYRHITKKGKKCGFPCSTVQGPERKTYHGKADFFAFYLIPEDLWYIIPLSAIHPRDVTAIHINPYNCRSRYFKFMEAWHLLKMRPRRALGEKAA
jgi:hypothetical protein